MKRRLDIDWPWGNTVPPGTVKKISVSGNPRSFEEKRDLPEPDYFGRQTYGTNDFYPGIAVPGCEVEHGGEKFRVIGLLETEGSARSEAQQVYYLGPRDYDGPTGYRWGEEL